MFADSWLRAGSAGMNVFLMIMKLIRNMRLALPAAKNYVSEGILIGRNGNRRAHLSALRERRLGLRLAFLVVFPV